MGTVNVKDLKIGMIVDKPIFSVSGGLLINRNVVLTEKNIDSIQKLDYERIWIQDGIDSSDDYLSHELKMKAVRTIKDVFTDCSSKKGELDPKKITVLRNVIGNLVDEIAKNKQSLVQLSNIKNFNNNMYEHAVDVTRISGLIGTNLGLNKNQLVNLAESAMLHDIGKTKFSLDLINKKTDYSKEEIEELTKHPSISQNMIKKLLTFSSLVTTSILQHHEKFDGTGYPYGVKGEKIQLYARIIRIADEYANLKTGTPNHKAYSQSDIIEYFYAFGGNFDPTILKIFMSKIPIYEIGQLIELSTGQKAVVLDNNKDVISRPIILVLKADGTAFGKIDLSDNNNITII